MREKLEQHRADPNCTACHSKIDPLGMAFDNYDAIGRWRTTDDGASIDPAGTMFNGVKVDGPVALRQMLVSRPETFIGVMTEKLLTYALGRGLEYRDMPAVRAIVRDSQKNNYRLSSLILGVVESAPFRMNTVGLIQ